MYLNYFIFTITFLYLSNWFQINTFIKRLLKSNNKSRKIRDKWISELIYERTNLKVDYVYLYDVDKPFGMMPGIPLKPHLILSLPLYETFNKKELEYVILHEAGHCVLWHTLKIGGAMFAILAFGLYLLNLINPSWYVVLLLAILFSLIFVQSARHFERETDYFAAEHTSDPKGMIFAAKKFVEAYPKDILFKLRREFLGWNVMPNERISIAEKELQKRKKW